MDGSMDGWIHGWIPMPLAIAKAPRTVVRASNGVQCRIPTFIHSLESGEEGSEIFQAAKDQYLNDHNAYQSTQIQYYHDYYQ